jgi:hypothetical protein
LVTGRSPHEQLAEFLERFLPEVSAAAAAALERLRARLPGAIEMVYDNYNALVIGFGPTERASDALVSIVVYPRYVSLAFLTGASLDDPAGVLQGDGKVARHVRLESPDVIDRPAVAALIEQAVARGEPWDPQRPRRLVIKSVSAKQRPRRPR